MSKYRGYDIRDQETRGARGFMVHDQDGMLLHRCGSEKSARKFIDKLNDPDSRGTRPPGWGGG